MAPRRKESAVDLCDRAVVLGNSIAIRMLEYLSTAKHQVQGFRDLASEFLEVSRILWAIESGLKTSAAAGGGGGGGGGGRKQDLPADVRTELERRFRRTHDDFLVLNQLVTRFLDNDKKHGFARFSKGFKMMFADSDVNKMRASLEKTREALRVSALVFRWSLGEDDVDATIGIGYTGLAAALDQMNGVAPARRGTGTGPTTTPAGAQLPPPPPPPPGRAPPTPQPAAAARHLEPSPLPDRPPALPHHADLVGSRLTGTTLDLEELRHELNHLPERAPSTLRSSGRSSKGAGNLRVSEVTVSAMSSPRSVEDRRGAGRRGGDDHEHDGGSTHTAETETLLEDLLGEADLLGVGVGVGVGIGIGDDGQQKQHRQATATRLKADPSTAPRWTPRFSTGASSPQYRTALLQAVQKRAHGAMEQLLDRGVAPDSVGEACLLREAVVNRDAEAVRLLLLFGADPNAVDGRGGSTPLLSAAELGFVEAARMLIRYGADPNLSAGAGGESPLAAAAVAAAAAGHGGGVDDDDHKLELARLLLAYGGDPDRIMASGNTAMIRAIDRRTPRRLVELMLDHGGDPDAKNGEGTSPLFQCVGAQRLDVALLLLDRGADPNLPGPKHLLWPSAYQPAFLRLLLARGADVARAPGVMELATSVNNLESVRVLLDAGVDPNAKKDGVYTPLCSAIRDDRGDMVDLLLARGADPNLAASEHPCLKCVTHQRAHLLPRLLAAGADPARPRGLVERAVLHDNRDALVLLLDHGGVGVDAKSPEGFTPLTTAIREDRADMVDLLLARGADPAVRGQDWPINLAVRRPAILKKLLPAVASPRSFRGVVEMAVCADQLESVRLLLRAGFSVEDKNGGVFSPLTSAIRDGNKPMVRYLVDEAGADVNAPGEHLPLVKAIRRMRGGDTEVLELLLDRGADVNRMYRGWNAVLQAVENGNADVLRLLVRRGNGVDLELRDENGQTVLDVVHAHGWDEAVQILTSGPGEGDGEGDGDGDGDGDGGGGGNASGRMSIFSELSWGVILGENGQNVRSPSRTSMETITELQKN